MVSSARDITHFMHSSLCAYHKVLTYVHVTCQTKYVWSDITKDKTNTCINMYALHSIAVGSTWVASLMKQTIACLSYWLINRYDHISEQVSAVSLLT